MSAKTEPMDLGQTQTASRLCVAPTWKDPNTGALFVHQDLLLVQKPWAEEGHIPPMNVRERFGDVESWVSYVQRYGQQDETAFLTWNAHGLRAVLDYASAVERGRRQWQAEHPFEFSVQWRAWMGLANGQAVQQKVAVERLEDLSEDITDPSPADLMALLRSLRASVNAKADAELRPDGTTSVAFTKDTTVKSGAPGSVDLPPSFTIAIPVLKGHVDGEGRPVLYRLQVRLRVSVDDAAHLALRFSIPNAERVLEAVYADRVRVAEDLLGEAFTLLRAAD